MRSELEGVVFVTLTTNLAGENGPSERKNASKHGLTVTEASMLSQTQFHTKQTRRALISEGLRHSKVSLTAI